MTDDDIRRLRARVDALTGPVRTRALLELGQALAERYWRAGPGQPSALPYLSEAIVAVTGAYGCFDASDAWRGQVASQLGWLHGARHLAHTSEVSDRDTGIAMLEEALAFPRLPPVLQTISRMTLGQLYLARLTRALQSPNIATILMTSGLPPDTTADADRAAECFQKTLDTPAIGTEAADAARAMLTVADAMRTMVSGLRGGPAGIDLNGMTQVVQVLQNLRDAQTAGAARGPSLPPVPSLFSADALAAMDPLDRPIAVVDVAGEPVPRRARPEAVAIDAAVLRRELHTTLAGEGDLVPAVEALLEPGAPLPSVGLVDDVVALATSVMAADGADGMDHLLLAVALYLRSRVDSGGWVEETGDGRRDDCGDHEGQSGIGADADIAAAAESALAAAASLPVQCPEAMPILLRLGDLLGLRRKLPSPRRRDRRPTGDAAVFVADPRGDRNAAAVEAMLLRRTFYPRSVGLGRTVENIDGAGTPAEVLARLDASMLHLGCGVTADGALELAGPARLRPEQIAAWTGGARKAGGVAVLPPAGAGLAVLADALLAAGFVGVVSWTREIPAPPAALMLFVLHAKLIDEKLEPAEAVESVRRWMRDPRRKPPDYLPNEHSATMTGMNLTDEEWWGALTYRAWNPHGQGAAA